MESVDVFGGVDGFDDFLLADVAGEGELDDESVDVGVGVEGGDLVEECLLGDVVFEADERGFESALLAGFYFVGYVGFGAAVVSDEDGGEVGALFAVGEHLLDLGGDFGFYLVGDFFSVDECHFF